MSDLSPLSGVKRTQKATSGREAIAPLVLGTFMGYFRFLLVPEAATDIPPPASPPLPQGGLLEAHTEVRERAHLA